MLVLFWTEHYFCIISNCKNSFNENKPKTYLTQKKVLKYFICIGSLFTGFSMQILYLCHDTLRIRSRLKYLKWCVSGK